MAATTKMAKQTQLEQSASEAATKMEGAESEVTTTKMEEAVRLQPLK